MKDLFKDDYNLNNLRRIRVRGYGFDLWVTPRFIHHYAYKSYEPMTSFIIFESAKNVHTFIDVGAHYGFYGVLVGRQNPNCRIFAFEPIPENYSILRKNLEANNIENVQLFQAAVSDQVGFARFQISEASDSSGFVANPAADILGEIEVKMVRLDQFIDQIPDRPCLVKVDTEGSEMKVLRGMETLIRRIDDLRLIVEFNPKCLRHNGVDPKELLKQIQHLGFSISFVHDDGSVQKYDGHTNWMDYMGGQNFKNLYCTKPSLVLRKGHDGRMPIRKEGMVSKKGEEAKMFSVANSKSSRRWDFKKVLLINHNLYPFERSGTPISTHNHALGLSRRGFQVAVLIPSFHMKESYSKGEMSGFLLYQVPALEKHVAYLSAASEKGLMDFKRTINQIIDDFSPDVVQINDYVYMPAEVVEIFSNRGCVVVRNVCNMEELCHRDYPVVSNGLENRLCPGPTSPSICTDCFLAHQGTSSEEGIDPHIHQDIREKVERRFEYIRFLYKNAVDKAIFTSEPFKAFFTQFVPIPEEKTALVPRGCEFDFEREVKILNRDDGKIHFAFIGNLMFSKGIDVVLRAFEMICNRKDFVLHLYGEIVDDKYSLYLKQLETLYPSKIRYYGPFNKDTIREIYRNIDVCLIPSYFDTYNRVVREALYFGVPVIATNFFGAFIIEDGKNGFRMPVGDAQAMAKKMVEILCQPALLETLYHGAAKTPIPTLDEEIDQLITNYSDLCREHQQKKKVGMVFSSHGKADPLPQKRVRPIAFYLPQFHPIPENDQWWGKGFTEWTNVTKAQPLFPDHYQPHLPADLGFYDLRLSEVREAQANLAKEYGIYGFCYYHYWFKGKMLLERPLEEVLRSGKPDFPFCLCWANENWTRVWDGQEKEVLLRQEYSEEDDLQHIQWLTRVFRDKRYIRIDGKPILLIYRANLLPNPARTAEIWRNEAKRLGVGELYLCRVESTIENHGDPKEIGFDAAVEFQPDWTNLGERLLNHPVYKRHFVFRYEDIVERMLKKNEVSYKRFPCVTPSWDNSARRKSGACIFIESNPDLYERWLREVIEKFKCPSPEENLVFINAWNEWAEGNHLEPDQRFGRGYLEATRRALWMAGAEPDFFSFEDIYKDCLSLIDKGREDEAILALEKFLTYEPNHPQAHNDLGVLYLKKGKYEKSCKYLERAIELDPERIEFRKNLANLYLELNHVEKALALYEQLMTINPIDLDILIKMAHCCFRSGRSEDCCYYLKKVLEIEPGNKIAMGYLDLLIDPKEKLNMDLIQKERKDSSPPQVSIIIPVFNNLNLTKKCLKSILQNIVDIKYEIIVVDDGSTDGTIEFLTQLKSPLIKTIFKNYRNGFIEACRSGAKIASGEYLLFLNKYTEVQQGWLTSLLQFAESNNDCGAVGSKLICPDENPKEKESIFYSDDHNEDNNRGRNPSDPHYHIVREVDYCVGAAIMVKKSLWNEIGGFEQCYSPAYFEDTDFCRKVNKRGFKVYHHLYRDSTFWNYLSTRKEGNVQANLTHDAIREGLEEVSAPQAPLQKGRLVSIVILCYNQLEYTQKCLNSIFQYTEVPFELVIVDNGSNDNTPRYLVALKEGRQAIGGWRIKVGEGGEITGKVFEGGKIKKKRKIRKDLFCKSFQIIFNGENLGFAAGNNRGMKEAKGDFIVLLNNDVVITPGWLDRLIGVAERNPQIGIVGPMSNYVSGPQLVDKVSYDTTTLAGLNQFAQDYAQRHKGQAKPFWRVVGFCMLIKRSVLEKIGGLDERYGLGNFEDDDFSLRARLAGFESWIAEDCFVHHFGSRTFAGSGIDYQESLKRNWEIFKKKWGIPSEIEYGASFDLSKILSQGFDPVRHYCPLTPEEYSLSRGEELFQAGDVEGAEHIFQKILYYEPKNLDALNNLGVLYFHKGEMEQAIAYLKKVLKLNENYVEALENLGSCFLAQSDFREAITWLNKALNLKPKDVNLLNALANCFIQLEDFGKAEELYKKSYEIDNNQIQVMEIIKEVNKMKMLGYQRNMNP